MKLSFDQLSDEFMFLIYLDYPKNAFGKRGRNTIVPHNKKFLNVIGQRDGMSSGDIIRINNMYQCQSLKSSVDYI